MDDRLDGDERAASFPQRAVRGKKPKGMYDLAKNHMKQQGEIEVLHPQARCCMRIGHAERFAEDVREY